MLMPRPKRSGGTVRHHEAEGTDDAIFKNYALKSMDDVNAKLDEAAFYIERNPTLVKSITSFPYIAKSL